MLAAVMASDINWDPGKLQLYLVNVFNFNLTLSFSAFETDNNAQGIGQFVQ